jgi:sterol desaturase/sphingolipid hydroxylase (fatty acid hydroxylase superfamily)
VPALQQSQPYAPGRRDPHGHVHARQHPDAQWLGYFISRPEMHAIHHERGAHSGNHCGLPVIDMIFGTYRNPETFEGAAGFYDGASARLVDMLLGRDVSVPASV